MRAIVPSIAVTCTAALIVCAGLRDLPGISTVSRTLSPAISLVGLDQSWRIFAPHPRQAGVRIAAVVRWSDGVETVWRPPTRDPLVGAYSDYRWRKWSENASTDNYGPRLWRALARYVARRLPARAGAVAIELRVVRYAQPLPRPGVATTSRWSSTEVYRARLAPHPL